MELNIYKKEASPDGGEFVASFDGEGIDIKVETPYFEVYDAGNEEESIDGKIEVPDVGDFQEITPEDNLVFKNKSSNIEEYGVSIQGEANVKNERHYKEEFDGNSQEEYMEFEDARPGHVKLMTTPECCNGGLLLLMPSPNISQYFIYLDLYV